MRADDKLQAAQCKLQSRVTVNTRYANYRMCLMFTFGPE